MIGITKTIMDINTNMGIISNDNTHIFYLSAICET